MSNRPKIPYVQSAASQDVPPPYHFPGVTVNAFIWDAEMAPIQAYCDRFFSLGLEEDRGFVYKPAAFWPYATMLFINYPAMVSSPRYRENTGNELGYNYRGVVSQTEVFVVMPVVRYGTTAGKLLLDTTLEWVLPFIVVGEPMSARLAAAEICSAWRKAPGADRHSSESQFPDSFCGAGQPARLAVGHPNVTAGDAAVSSRSTPIRCCPRSGASRPTPRRRACSRAVRRGG